MKNIKDFEKFVNETYINDGGELVDSDGHETEVISSESNDDDFTKVEHSEGLDIEITKKECDEKNPKKCEEYDVVYTKKNNDVTYIIYGSLVPYETGRTTNYKFIPDDFEDQESEDYYDENSEEIEDEIIDRYYA